MKFPSDPIVYETSNLHCLQVAKDQFSIHLHAGTHSFKIGSKTTLDDAKRLMDKLEKHPANLPYLVAPEDRYKVELHLKK